MDKPLTKLSIVTEGNQELIQKLLFGLEDLYISCDGGVIKFDISHIQIENTYHSEDDA